MKTLKEKYCLHFDANTTIEELQYEFKKLYPLLKIEFFTKSHDPFKGSFSKFQITEITKKLGEVTYLNGKYEVLCLPNMNVTTFEQQFEDIFSLHVQVFRKGKGMWLETINTDSWTLEEQMEVAKESNHEGLINY